MTEVITITPFFFIGLAMGGAVLYGMKPEQKNKEHKEIKVFDKVILKNVNHDLYKLFKSVDSGCKILKTTPQTNRPLTVVGGDGFLLRLESFISFNTNALYICTLTHKGEQIVSKCSHLEAIALNYLSLQDNEIHISFRSNC